MLFTAVLEADRRSRPRPGGGRAVGDRGRGVGQPHALAQPAVEVHGAQPHRSQPAGSGVHAEPVARIQYAPQLPVDAHGGPSRPFEDPQSDGLVGGGDHRAVERHVRGHRREDERFRAGRDDRAARGETVGGGAGRRGHEQRVGGVGGEQPAGDVDADGDLPVPRQLFEDHVVEGRDVQRDPPLVPALAVGTHAWGWQQRSSPVPQERLHLGRDLQHPGGTQREQHAGLRLQVTAPDGVERGAHRRGGDLGQESDAAQVHAEDQGVVLRRQPCAAQEGAVAAQGDDEVRVARRGHLLAGAAPALAAPHVDVRADHGVLVAPFPDLPCRQCGAFAASVDHESDPFDRHHCLPASGRRPWNRDRRNVRRPSWRCGHRHAGRSSPVR